MSALEIKANEVPAIRVATAIARKVNKNLLFVVSGGLGDRVCAEPTLRYALNKFKDCRISLCCDTPELFRHLEFDAIFRNWRSVPENKFLALYTYPDSTLALQFLSPNLMNSVDLASVCSLLSTLPPNEKNVVLSPREPENDDLIKAVETSGTVFIHPGKTWPTRTFPSAWWESVAHLVCRSGRLPVLIGDSTVDLDLENVKYPVGDFRKKLSLNDFMWVCQNARQIITNDSSPLHLAASGSGQIVFIPTVRNPALLLHHRGPIGSLGWGMIAPLPYGIKKMWEMFNACPNVLQGSDLSKIPERNSIEEFLPEPEYVVRSLEGKCN